VFGLTETDIEPDRPWPKRALVVDDYEDFLRLLCTYLESLGIRCESATSGEQATELLDSVLFDLLVVDKNLPDLDGITVARQARMAHPDLSVLVITGYPSEESAHRAAVAGVRDYIQKPFDVGVFCELVRDLTSEAPAAASRSPYSGQRSRKVSTVPPADAALCSKRVAEWTPRPSTVPEPGEESSALSVLLVERDELVRDRIAEHLELINCEVAAFAEPEMAEAYRPVPAFDVLVARPSVLSSRAGWLAPREESGAPLGALAVVCEKGIDDVVRAIRVGARGALVPPFGRSEVISEFTAAVMQLIGERYGVKGRSS